MTLNKQISFAQELFFEKNLKTAKRESTILESIVKSYRTGSKEYHRQQKVLNILENEQYEVLTDLYVSTAASKRAQDCKLQLTLLDLLDEHDNSCQNIETKQNYLEAIDFETHLTKKRIASIGKIVLSDKQYMERIDRGRENLRCLENKLELGTKQYGAVMGENKKIRQDIDHLLIDRINFNKLWYAYVANLYKGKRIMLDLIEQATISYNIRNEWVQNLNALRDLSLDSYKKHRAEMENLQKTLNRNHEIREFFLTKSIRRSLYNLEQEKIKKREKTRTQMTDTLRHHKQILNNIKSFTTIDTETDGDHFMYYFQYAEEQILSDFALVSDLQSDIDILVWEITELQNSIETIMTIHKNRTSQQFQKIEELNAQLGMTTKEVEVEEENLEEINSTLHNVCKGIQNLFDICSCCKSNFGHLLGDNATVNQYSVFLFLETIENSVDDLLMNVYRTEKFKKIVNGVINETLKARNLFEINNIVRSSPCPLCVDREMVNNLVDTLQFVQARHEVEQFLRQRLTLPDGLERLHNVSACILPQSRAIIQRRYQ